MAKYLFEFKQLIKIGVPIFGSQLSYTLMGATDTIIAGRASANDLAGLAVGYISEKSSSIDKRRRIYEPTEILIKDFLEYSESILRDNSSSS